jgi:hypothetical protein
MVIQNYYLEFLTKLQERVRKKKAGIVEEEIMGSASRQCASSQRPRGEAGLR